MQKAASRSVFLIFLIILVGTGLDFIAHQTPGSYPVPSYYFRNKIIFGALWGVAFYWLICRHIKNRMLAAFAFSALLSVALQIRYFLEGYPLSFVLIFLVIHFVVFVFPAYFFLPRISHMS